MVSLFGDAEGGLAPSNQRPRVILLIVLFFFSSRRRHTRCSRDWSSDVCSSDLNYIPWRGYFDLISQVDEFILFDDVQYTRRDWRNRNRIKAPNGSMWLTIPVEVKGKRDQNIKDTVISDPGWSRNHWRTIVYNYSKTKYFSEYKELFESLYLERNEKLLSQV